MFLVIAVIMVAETVTVVNKCMKEAEKLALADILLFVFSYFNFPPAFRLAFITWHFYEDSDNR